MARKKTSVNIDEDVLREVEKRLNGQSISDLIDMLLRSWLEGQVSTNQEGVPTIAEGEDKPELIRIKASRYPFTCKQCGREYPQGTPGYWNPATKTMICELCHTSTIADTKVSRKTYKMYLEVKALEAQKKKLEMEIDELLQKARDAELKVKEAEIATDIVELEALIQQFIKGVELMGPEEIKTTAEQYRRIAKELIDAIREYTRYSTIVFKSRKSKDDWE